MFWFRFIAHMEKENCKLDILIIEVKDYHTFVGCNICLHKSF